MRILIDPSSFHSLNLGDVAMLQVTVRRLQHFWPHAELLIFGDQPELLKMYCPFARALEPQGRDVWFSAAAILTRTGRRFSMPSLTEIDVEWRQRWPGLAEKVVALRAGRAAAIAVRAVIDVVRSCDLVVASGAGQITTTFGAHSTLILNTMEAAVRHGIPVVLFGQGIGPIDDACLRARAAKVLPQASLICLREAVTGPGLVQSLGVPPEKVMITGDDAIDMAYCRRPESLGNAIGVNLRLSWYSEMGTEVIEAVRGPLQEAARALGAPLLSVPISRHPDERDQEVFEQLAAGYPSVLAPTHDVLTTEGIIDEVGRCRVVISTSYHGGLFSLSQGIPVVAWLQSKYFATKLHGLAKQFGTGCEIVFMDEENPAERLHSAIESAYNSASQTRPKLLDAAASQVALSKAAYARVYRDVMGERRHKL
jgi:polysaccharide pyruvyl transferase WcaK-like protein